MASEDFLAAAAGALQGFARGFLPFKQAQFQSDLLTRRRAEESEARNEEFGRRLSLREESDIRVSEATRVPPRDVRFVDREEAEEGGTFSGAEDVRLLPTAPTEKKEKQLLRKSEFLKRTDAGEKLLAEDFTIVDDTTVDRPDKTQLRQDEGARRAVSLIKNYYRGLNSLQGEDEVGFLESLGRGAQGISAQIPVTGRAITPKTSQLVKFRKSQGARLAKAFGDAGNIAFREQKNALELLSPLGTRNPKVAEKQALTVALEGIKNRSPEEESLLKEAREAFNFGRPPSLPITGSGNVGIGTGGDTTGMTEAQRKALSDLGF